MSAKETTTIRISSDAKKKLDGMRDNQSYSQYITDMISYFEMTGMTPRSRFKIPAINIEKRIEDLIKIVKCQERDILLPILRRETIGENNDNREVLARLANENKALKEELKRAANDSSDKAELYKNKLDSLVSLVVSACDKSNFRQVKFGTDLQVSASFFDKLVEKIKEDYVL